MEARALFWIMDRTLMSVLGSEDVRAGHSLTFGFDLQKKDGRRCEYIPIYRPMNSTVTKVQRGINTNGILSVEHPAKCVLKKQEKRQEMIHYFKGPIVKYYIRYV